MLTIEVATRGEEKKKLIYPFTFSPLLDVQTAEAHNAGAGYGQGYPGTPHLEGQSVSRFPGPFIPITLM